MEDKKEGIIGGVYRKLGVEKSGTKSGNYYDLVLTFQEKNQYLFKIIYAPKNADEYTIVGKVYECTTLKGSFLVASSIEEYKKLEDTKIPVKVVEKEKIVKVHVPVEKKIKVRKWDDTLFDALYNWYCKRKNRSFDDFV